jgi:hypothetical protein
MKVNHSIDQFYNYGEHGDTSDAYQKRYGYEDHELPYATGPNPCAICGTRWQTFGNHVDANHNTRWLCRECEVTP